MSHHKWDFLEGVLPRLAFTAFCFAQPFLVERVINFMSEPEHVNSTNYAYGLVAAYAIVYLGIAVCSILRSMRAVLINTDFLRCLRTSDESHYHHGSGKLSDSHLRQDVAHEHLCRFRFRCDNADEYRYRTNWKWYERDPRSVR